MKPEPASAPFAGPYALGTFSAPDGPSFPDLVTAMQDESTKDMVFGVAHMVAYASQTARLLPGDLVLTGSPAGNGMHWGRLLRDGDVMDGSITGLGAQRTRCVAEAS